MEINRKKALIIGAGVAAFLGVLLVATQVFFKSKQTELVSPTTNGPTTETLAPQVTWEDPAGFSFDYPGNLETDPHQEDDENYAHVELTITDHAGSLVVWMKDTTYTAIDDWAQKESEALAEQIFDTTLGGHEAKKVLFTDGRILSAALDQEVIVLVEMLPGDAQFWLPIYDHVVDSFEFIALASEESTPPVSSGGSEIWEEEEIVE